MSDVARRLKRFLRLQRRARASRDIQEATQQLRAAVEDAGQLKIVIGAGGVPHVGWVLTDIDSLDLLDPTSWEALFANRPIDALLAEHVWEHLTSSEGTIAAKTCYRYLRPGGYLRVAVPDGNHPDPRYLEWVRPHGRGPGAHDHKILYTWASFSEVFGSAGFEVKKLEYFDSQGSFHFSEWDSADGMIHRSSRYDERNSVRPLSYTSIILDAIKPGD